MIYIRFGKIHLTKWGIQKVQNAKVAVHATEYGDSNEINDNTNHDYIRVAWLNLPVKILDLANLYIEL